MPLPVNQLEFSLSDSAASYGLVMILILAELVSSSFQNSGRFVRVGEGVQCRFWGALRERSGEPDEPHNGTDRPFPNRNIKFVNADSQTQDQSAKVSDRPS